MKNIIVVIFALVIAGCASTKGYIGEELPDNELAIVYGPDIQIFSSSRPAAYIGSVNNIVVGSFTKGYPDLVKVKPGEVDITLNLTWPSLSNGLAALGGAVGAVTVGAANASANDENRKSFRTEVEKGKTYKLYYTVVEGQRDINVIIEEFTPH